MFPLVIKTIAELFLIMNEDIPEVELLFFFFFLCHRRQITNKKLKKQNFEFETISIKENNVKNVEG